MQTSLSIFPAWLLLLRIRLVQAIHLQGDFSLDISFSNITNGDFWSGGDRQIGKITALKRVKNTTQIVYSSAIAYQLTSHTSLSAGELTDQIYRRVTCNTSSVYIDWVDPHLPARLANHFWEKVWDDIAVQVTPTGLIQFFIGDRAIALWLDWLICHPCHIKTMVQNKLDIQTPAWVQQDLPYARIFALQHAYARCCSLLQLAERQGLISLVPLPDPPGLWQLTAPAPLPWEGLFAQPDQLPERHLISQLVTALDTLVTQLNQAPATEWMQLAETVSQSVMQLHRDRPVLADQSQSSHDLICARLGLVMATQRVLRLLLEDILGIYAPSEL